MNMDKEIEHSHRAIDKLFNEDLFDGLFEGIDDRDCEHCKHHTPKGCTKWKCSFEKRMSYAEAAEWLEKIKEKYIHGGDEEYDRCRKEALDVAINALREIT